MTRCACVFPVVSYAVGLILFATKYEDIPVWEAYDFAWGFFIGKYNYNIYHKSLDLFVTIQLLPYVTLYNNL